MSGKVKRKQVLDVLSVIFYLVKDELLRQELEEKDSLLSMHEKARKRKMKEDEKSGKVNVRRPFDREVDLQVSSWIPS